MHLVSMVTNLLLTCRGRECEVISLPPCTNQVVFSKFLWQHPVPITTPAAVGDQSSTNNHLQVYGSVRRRNPPSPLSQRSRAIGGSLRSPRGAHKRQILQPSITTHKNDFTDFDMAFTNNRSNGELSVP